ncbi:stage II sporulation protein M [Paenibacillus phoenicis]|uniref:Stage II sporulation protein M n=1 Tax=Paenibacillus phoenicis TaxID=554117 RepID=A0ABU5PMP1_9BACL|nr:MULTISPECIES: stage II sporulation protein M [Paenibacillus]EES71491.1 membrane protein [Paenibacillus sp. oral taxon 786 str. D14]MCT2196549.1 stage II sporulation protein M [Paenibacillus sp. p3-SID1389]MEA3571190.1 stage II sporulation protein M [Paenibacillus phoenicis]
MFSIRRFICDLRKYKKAMLLSILIFAAGLALGAANADTLTRIVMPDLERLSRVSRDLAQSDHPEWSFFLFIFFNNVTKSIGVMLLGAILGILPAFFLLMNGLALGFVVMAAGGRGENLMDLIVRGLLPHGIIEIPAILIAAGFGMQFGYLALKSLGEAGSRDASERTVDWRGFLVSAGRGAVWIVVMLLVAAVIESTVTFYLVGGAAS